MSDLTAQPAFADLKAALKAKGFRILTPGRDWVLQATKLTKTVYDTLTVKVTVCRTMKACEQAKCWVDLYGTSYSRSRRGKKLHPHTNYLVHGYNENPIVFGDDLAGSMAAILAEVDALVARAEEKRIALEKTDAEWKATRPANWDEMPKIEQLRWSTTEMMKGIEARKAEKDPTLPPTLV